MKHSVYFIFWLFLFALSLSACKKHKTQVDIGNENQILHIGNGTEPATIDPHLASGIPEYHLLMTVFQGLVGKDPKTLQVVPGVADSWVISDDGLIYTFHIRDNARWSNGDKLTAFDFVYSWHRLLLPAIASERASDLFVVSNAEAFSKGEITDFNKVGIKALDEFHLQITLRNPTTYFLIMLDNFNFYPVHRPTIEKFGAFDERVSRWTRPENFVGNGPFTIDEWIPSVVFSVKPNPYYWDAQSVKLKQIRFYPYDNILLEERMFRVGQLHKTEFLPSSKIQVYKDSPAYHSYAYYGVYYYVFNTKVKPLDDVRVRKALAYAIDREAITNSVLKGGQLPLFHFTPDDPYGYKAQANMVYDVNLAQKLLADAGYPNGEGFPSMELTYNTHADHLKVALAIQQMWKKNLGVDIKLHNLEWKVYLDVRRAKQFQIMRRGVIADVLDPSSFLFSMVSDDPLNDTNWGNSRYDELIELSKTATTDEQRYGYFQEADQIIVDEVPLMPIYSYTTNYLVSPAVKGFYPNVLDYHPYTHVYLEAAEH